MKGVFTPATPVRASKVESDMICGPFSRHAKTHEHSVTQPQIVVARRCPGNRSAEAL